jgi:diguanylate cyclase (GGDEF)-like protein
VASANLWAEPEFNQRKRAESFVLDVYFGLLLSLMGFNLVLYFTIKEYRYLYYVALAASMFFCAGSFNGLWFQLLWPTWPNWHQISVPIGFCSVGITAILFSRSFLQTQVETPKLDKLLLLIALGFTGIIIASPFTNLSLIINLSSIAAIAMAVVALSAGIVVALKNKDYAWLYVIAWLSLLLGTIIFSAQVTGWIHSSTLTRYAIFIGSTVEMILLSFALTLQINYFKDQVTESQSIALAANRKLIAFLKDNEKELSERVYERTQALDEANQHLREQETILTKLAHYDELTEVANRSFLTEQFKHLLARAKRDEFSFAIFFLDLNYFKTINDTYGHKTGDELLIHTARQLRQTLRESDIVGRLGGDEFLILVEIKPEDANLAVLIEKIKLAIASPITINEQEYITSVSIGVAQYPIDGDEIDTLMNIADKRMYQDKRRIKLGKSSPING